MNTPAVLKFFRLIAFGVLVSGSLGVQLVQAQTPPSQPSPAYRAEDFIEFVGINGSPIISNIHEDGPFKGAGRTHSPDVFYDLGIRHYRLGLRHSLVREDQPQQVLDAWKKSGARAMMMLDHLRQKPEEIVPELNKYDRRTIAELEGPNEPNNKFPPQDLNHKYKGKTDEAATATYMDEVYQFVKADAKWKNLPVVAYSAIFTDYNLAKGHTGFDYGNIHSYQGYGVPSSSLESNITRFNNILPAGSIIKPFVPTEFGYNVEADVANGTHKTGSLRAQALNIPMLLAEYFRHGIKRGYLFAIHNADGYGLLESDLKTKRPSYFALKNFLDLIREAKWNPATLKWEGAREFTPRALLFQLQGAPETVHSLTLQKGNGEYTILLWNEVQNFDQNTRNDLYPAPVPVAMKFTVPVGKSATVLLQNDKGAYDTSTQSVQNGALRLNVPSSVMLIKISAGALPRITPPAAPQGLDGSATAHEANLKWSAVPQATGYFVFRNGWHLATVNDTQFSERTSWLRPGLGYTYEVQAFDKWGQTSPRVAKVIFTPNGRPDLVVTRIWAESKGVGQRPTFRATIKNIGDGPTPLDSVASGTFYVNGQFTSYFDGSGVLNPGEERTREINGGNVNWVPDKLGAYQIKVWADDINRVSGEISESNNVAEMTMHVGKTPGLLHVESAPVLGGVNLSQEGTLDWIAWGQSGNKEKAEARADVVTKANGPKLFGALEEFGEGYLSATVGSAIQLNWNDGSGITEKQNTYSGLWWNGVGHGTRFTVNAGTQERLLKLYVSGVNGARGKLEASISDNSSPVVVSNTWDGNRGNGNWAPIPDGFAAVYTIRYRATAPNQKLTISWSMDNEPNQWAGQLRLQAATLADAK